MGTLQMSLKMMMSNQYNQPQECAALDTRADFLIRKTCFAVNM